MPASSRMPAKMEILLEALMRTRKRIVVLLRQNAQVPHVQQVKKRLQLLTRQIAQRTHARPLTVVAKRTIPNVAATLSPAIPASTRIRAKLEMLLEPLMRTRKRIVVLLRQNAPVPHVQQVKKRLQMLTQQIAR
jgi:hypothetical protein